MRVFALAAVIGAALFFTGCGEEGEESASETAVSGSHFQGRDCLACHNADLQQERHLSVGGTLFKDANVSDVNDLSLSCGVDFVVDFLVDPLDTAPISSIDYEDLDSKGYRGKGNIFILSRLLATLNGDYYIRIKERETNRTIAQSGLHSFAAGDYDVGNSTDLSNRNACNACHQQVGQSGATGYMFANARLDLCQ
jgi:cytochrome c551/c552